MKRSRLFISTLTLLALGVASPVLFPGSQTAWAQDDREKAQEQRRVLKATDMTQLSVSEAYRAAAREKRHESIEFLKQIIAERNPQGE